MANNTNTNPFVLDTAGLVTDKAVIIKAISFQGTTDGDDLIINSGSDTNLIWSTKLGTVATVGYEKNITFGKGIPVNGIYLNTIDNGKVLIYF